MLRVMAESGSTASGDPESSTGRHIMRAKAGDSESLSVLVRRFDPMLFAAARVMMGAALRATCEPEDLVMEVWSVAIRRLPELRAEAGPSMSRSFCAFLTGTLRRLVNTRLRRVLRQRPTPRPDDGDEVFDPLALPDSVTGVTADLMAREERRKVAEAIDGLGPEDRKIVIMHGLEGLSHAEIATLTGIAAGTLAVRYHRAISRLREALPDSFLEAFGQD